MKSSETSSARHARFETMVSCFNDDLYRYAIWLSRDPEQAKDVVQETMLRAWRSLDSLADEKAVKSWLLTIARNENNRIYARKRFNTVNIDDLDSKAEQLLATQENTDVGDVRAALEKLDINYREPLVLQALLGHSSKEIGEIIGLKTDAVNTRLFRARAKLQSILTESEKPPQSTPRPAPQSFNAESRPVFA